MCVCVCKRVYAQTCVYVLLLRELSFSFLTNDEFALDFLQDEPGLIAEFETLGRQLSFEVGLPLIVVVETDIEELAQNHVRRVVFDDLVVPVKQHHRVARQRGLDFEELEEEKKAVLPTKVNRRKEQKKEGRKDEKRRKERKKEKMKEIRK